MSFSRTKAAAGLISGLGLITAYLFFTGWIYILSYFTSFGVSSNALKLPMHSFLAYSFAVCSDFKFVLIIAVIVLYLIATSRFRYDRFLLISDVILALIAFGAIYLLAMSRGSFDASKRMMASDTMLPNVSIGFEDQSNAPGSVENLRLLTYTDTDLYAFVPLDNKSNDHNVNIFVFPRKSIRFMSIKSRR